MSFPFPTFFPPAAAAASSSVAAPIPGQGPQPQQQIDPQILQTLYPQAFQALALQQQALAATMAATKQGIPQMQIYQALAASFPGVDSANSIMQQFQQSQMMMQMQQQQQQQQQHAREKGADQFDDDYEDDDEDYEEDEAPRKRRKAKKPVGAPKPKGAPRNYVVCKDCPGCHLKVGNNTRVCRGCGHLFSNVKEHAKARHSIEAAPQTNADGTPLQARKSGRKRTRHNPANSFDFLDKDEAAHLQIALQNSLVEVKTGGGDLSKVVAIDEFRPSLEEWKDPIAYIEKIRPEAEKFGLAKIIPPAGWNPPNVLNKDFKFSTRLQQIHRLQEAAGFEVGKTYNALEYEKMANDYKAKWVKERNDRTGAVGEPSVEEIEQAYWRVVETANPAVEVEYGNDISNVTSGGHAAFEPANAQMDPSRYAGGVNWNLNLLPHADGSVLKSLSPVQGVTQPWLYLGMMFASFCWHSEDDYLFSMNYMHQGASKIWYAVPAKKSQQFEKVLQRTLAQLIYEEPDLHMKLVTMLSPSLLESHQVPVCRAVQEAGTFIVTFPKSYHAGFSLGFNIAEAVNFATDNWFQYGREAFHHHRKYLHGSVLSYSQLLFDCILNQRWKYHVDILRDELLHLYESELRGRRQCRDYGVSKKVRIDLDNFERNQELECTKCRVPLYLSFLCCPCVLNHSHLVDPPRIRLPDEPPQQQQNHHQSQSHDVNVDQQVMNPDHHHDPNAMHHDGNEHQHQHQDPHQHEDHHHLAFEAPQHEQHHDDNQQMHQEHQHQHQHQQDQVAQPSSSNDVAGSSAPSGSSEPRYSSLCMCECNHQLWCLDHVRHARWALNTDHGGPVPVMFFRHVLPELVAMDEILALEPSEEEKAGKISAIEILKERTAALDLEKDELPPTPPPVDADVSAVEAAEAAAAVAAVAPKVKKEKKRRILKRESEDDDDDFLPGQNADEDDSEDETHHPVRLPHAVAAAAGGYVPIHHPAMFQHTTAAAAAAKNAASAETPKPRTQPRRSLAAKGREDALYVNLDLVELDDAPEEDNVEIIDPNDVEKAGTSSKRGVGLVNPQVRQALSAIVEAIVEVSGMKPSDDAMQVDSDSNTANQPAAAAASNATANAAAVAAAAAVASLPQIPASLTPTQLMQYQLMHQAALLQAAGRSNANTR